MDARAGDGDALRQEQRIETPENVSFGYEVVGIGNRFLATVADSALLAALFIALHLAFFGLLAAVPDRPEVAGGADGEGDVADWVVGLVLAAYFLIQFGIVWGYYSLFEWLWRGRTPGKRLLGIRVLRVGGASPGASEAVIRNLVRLVDFLPFAYGLGLLTMLFNADARRLGDFAAGTLVVRDEGDESLAALRARARAPHARGPGRAGGEPLSGDSPAAEPSPGSAGAPESAGVPGAGESAGPSEANRAPW